MQKGYVMHLRIACGLVLLLLATCLGPVEESDQITVSGTVKDKTGRALEGANVRLVDARIATLTGPDGTYELSAQKSSSAAPYDYVVATLDDYKGEGVELTDVNATVNFTLSDVVCANINSTPGPSGYRVVRPNGGEVFYTGEICSVTVTSEVGANASATIYFGPGALYHFPLPESETSFDPKTDSLQVFTIPEYFLEDRWVDSLEDFVADTISLVSDSCVIQIVDYDNAGYSDFGDCYFAIKAR